MSWTYSGDPATSELDEVRFLVQDTVQTRPLLQNEELQYLVDFWKTRYDSLIFVASVAAAVIARKYAGKVTVQADGVAVNVSDISPRYTQMAADLRREHSRAAIGAEVDISDVLMGHHWDPSIEPTTFGMHLHDNPEAGQQDFGGQLPDIWSALEELERSGYFT